jgi:hypothetical protein
MADRPMPTFPHERTRRFNDSISESSCIEFGQVMQSSTRRLLGLEKVPLNSKHLSKMFEQGEQLTVSPASVLHHQPVHLVLAVVRSEIVWHPEYGNTSILIQKYTYFCLFHVA